MKSKALVEGMDLVGFSLTLWTDKSKELIESVDGVAWVSPHGIYKNCFRIEVDHRYDKNEVVYRLLCAMI